MIAAMYACMMVAAILTIVAGLIEIVWGKAYSESANPLAVKIMLSAMLFILASVLMAANLMEAANA